MKKQIALTLMILLLFISCGTKKSMIKSKSENNIETEIKSITNTTTEIGDSIGITINEQIEETINDTSTHQTTKRIINRRTDITKAGNTITKQTEETQTDIKEQNKEENQTKTTINKTNPIRKYIIICFLILFLVYLIKRKENIRKGVLKQLGIDYERRKKVLDYLNKIRSKNATTSKQTNA